MFHMVPGNSSFFILRGFAQITIAFSALPPLQSVIQPRACGLSQAVGRFSHQAALLCFSSCSIRAASSLRAFSRRRSLAGLSLWDAWLI
jgi:hypothetical protein